MSDVESQLKAADPLHSLESTPIDFRAIKSRVTSQSSAVATVSRHRQMKFLSFATVAILVTTVTLVSVTSNNAVFHGPRAPLTPRGSGTSVVYGTSAAPAATGSVSNGTKGDQDNYAPATPPTPVYAAGAGLSAPLTSGSVYKLDAFNDAASEAQHLATLFGVTGTVATVPTQAFAAEYQAGDMGTATGSLQYFIASQDSPDASVGTFQYIADGAADWTFNGPITSTVDPATAARDLSTVRTLWNALNTGFTLTNPKWMVMQLQPPSNSFSTSETQVNFTLSVDGYQTTQGVQFSFDDAGKLVYAVGPNLSIIGSVTFPFETMAATIEFLDAQKFGDCSPTVVATGGVTMTSTPTLTPTTTAPVITETLGGVSILYQPEMMSNGEPWLVPFYQFTVSDGMQSSAPLISALGPAYFSVNKSATSCTMTLTQP
jgi:hypothetical protein